MPFHYGGGAYQVYPYPVPMTEPPVERSASPPAMYYHGGHASPPMVFNGGSPPLPTGFVSVPGGSLYTHATCLAAAGACSAPLPH